MLFNINYPSKSHMPSLLCMALYTKLVKINYLLDNIIFLFKKFPDTTESLTFCYYYPNSQAVKGN